MAIELRFGVLKDPWSATTHFAGFIASLVGVPFLLVPAWGDGAVFTSMSIYGVALAGLFLASSLYHFFDFGVRGNHWLRRVDHAAIFLFIAACYVPISTLVLEGAFRVTMLSVVGVMGVGGALYKLLRFHAPMWADMTAYLSLGWLGVLMAPQVLSAMDGGGMALMYGGGVAYTVGAVVFIRERPDPWPDTFGHHEIWHLLVLAGATAHYFFIYKLLDL